MRILERNFYKRHPAEVAPDLLGKVLVRELDGVRVTGRIVEVEAYSSNDPASHTFRGMTERNRAMFGDVGHAYVYFIHGMHYCMNITARSDLPAGGVLIRALEPLDGIDVMRRLRRRESLLHLASGPAKLTQAMRIDKQLYAADLTRPGPLYVCDDGVSVALAEPSPRIGVSRAIDVPWRFTVAGSPYVSR